MSFGVSLFVASAIFNNVVVLLFEAKAILGAVRVSLVVAGVTFGNVGGSSGNIW